VASVPAVSDCWGARGIVSCEVEVDCSVLTYIPAFRDGTVIGRGGKVIRSGTSEPPEQIPPSAKFDCIPRRPREVR
jgi:hypothetical protein